MPRRPLRRVFGETSIELKCLILFGVFLLLVITASFLSYWIVTESVVQEQKWHLPHQQSRPLMIYVPGVRL